MHSKSMIQKPWNFETRLNHEICIKCTLSLFISLVFVCTQCIYTQYTVCVFSNFFKLSSVIRARNIFLMAAELVILPCDPRSSLSITSHISISVKLSSLVLLWLVICLVLWSFCFLLSNQASTPRINSPTYEHHLHFHVALCDFEIHLL